MFKKNYSEYDNVVTPVEDVEELAGFKVGEVALYNNLIVKIERIDLRSGIYLSPFLIFFKI